MTKQNWTKIGGLSLGIALVSFLFLLLFSGDPRLDSLTGIFTWGILLGAIGLMVGVVGRGFTKS